MKKWIAFCVFALIGISSFAQNDNGDVIRPGDSMPSFILQSAGGKTIDSKALKGKVVMVNVFATWCPPCQVELADVQKTLWPKYKGNPNFVLLVVGREHSVKELQVYNEKKGFAFPLYADPDRAFSNQFATSSIPRTYLFDKAGKVVYSTVGYGSSGKEMDELMKKINELLK